MTPPRVLVTRPCAEGRWLALKLEPLGVVPVLAPVMAIEPLPAVLPECSVEAVLATSAHATSGLSAHDREAIRRKPVFAVGAATAAGFRRDGFTDVRVAAGDAEALVSLVRLTHAGLGRFLYLCGRVRKPVLAEAMQLAGHDLRFLETYDTKVLSWPIETVSSLREVPPAACLHFSNRSAALFLAEARRVGLDDTLGRTAQLCLSEDVATALRGWAQQDVVVAARPTTDSLLQALAATVTLAP